jgi:hypothetical protein
MVSPLVPSSVSRVPLLSLFAMLTPDQSPKSPAGSDPVVPSEHQDHRDHRDLDEKPYYQEETTFSDPLPLPVSKDQPTVYASSISDAGALALEQNPFLDPDVATHWTTVYEKSQYECRHVFDPAFTWSADEERKLVRRLDWHVCLWAVS